MTLDPGQVVTAVVTGLVLGAAKAVELLSKRKRVRGEVSRGERIEAKVDELREDMGEVKHRLSVVEQRDTPQYERVNGVRR